MILKIKKHPNLSWFQIYLQNLLIFSLFHAYFIQFHKDLHNILFIETLIKMIKVKKQIQKWEKKEQKDIVRYHRYQ